MKAKPSEQRTAPFLVVIVGPTAVGKTLLTARLARHFHSPVLNADSRQVYREMKVGTARPSDEEMLGVKHYFVADRGVCDPLTAGGYEKEALIILEEEFRRNSIVFLSGGSGLYIKAVTEGLDQFPKIPDHVRVELNNELKDKGLDFLLKELATKDPDYFSKVDQRNPQRVLRALEVIRFTEKPFSAFHKHERTDRPFSIVKIGLKMDRAELYERIDRRMDQMLAGGLMQEVAALEGYRDLDPLKTVGYQEVFAFQDGKYDHDEMVRLLKQNSRRYAKRQLTWWRKDPEITWFHPKDETEIISFLEAKFS